MRKKHPKADVRGNANFKGRGDKEKAEDKINMMIWEVGNGKKNRKETQLHIIRMGHYMACCCLTILILKRIISKTR